MCLQPGFPIVNTSEESTVQCHNRDTDMEIVKGHISKTVRIPQVPFAQPYPLPPFPNPYLIIGKHQSVLHYYNFVIFKMLHKWNFIVCNVLRLAYFTQDKPPRIRAGCCILSTVLSFILLSNIPWYGINVPQSVQPFTCQRTSGLFPVCGYYE